MFSPLLLKGFLVQGPKKNTTIPLSESKKSVIQECRARVSYRSPKRVFRKSVRQESVRGEGPTRVSHKSDIQECRARVSHGESVPQECPARMSHINVPQECFTRLFFHEVADKSVPHKPDKSVPTRMSHPTTLSGRVSHQSVLQECPTRVSDKSVLQERLTRVSHKSVPHAPQECRRSCNF